VAQFIGRTNLLAARVVAVDASGTTVEVAGHRLQIGGQSPATQPGRTVRLVVRPETIDLTGAEACGGLPGRVASRMYLGEKVEYQVRVGEELIQVTSYNPRVTYTVGEAVSLHLPADGIPLLPGAST
jgi:ABC-type Fe3+/spermidine/putrescine transport system ATPase subunit